MKKVIFISMMILLVSCTKKEYKVNFTFSHFDTQIKKSLKSEPANLYVVAKDSTELENAIRDTLSEAYCFAAQDIVINNIAIEKNNDSRNTTTFFLTLNTDETYSFLNRFTKKYVLKGNFTKTYTNYSPNLIDRKKIDAAYLAVNKRNVKLIDYTGNTLIAFEIIPINIMNEFMNGTPNFNSKSDLLPFLLKSKQYINPDFETQKHYLVSNYLLQFIGVNSNYKDIEVCFTIENNYGLNNELFVNEMTLRYSKNDIKYSWYLYYE